MKKSYKMISLDIIEGIDDEFYIVDVNGLIGIRSVIEFSKEFTENIKNIIGEDYHFECPELKINPNAIANFDLINGGLNLKSDITIYNTKFPLENKLKWRNKLKLKSPKIGRNISYHDHPNYPKYLVKPQFCYQGKGILLYNDFNPNIDDQNIQVIKNLFESSDNGIFFEQFIPSKLIDRHCYSVLVLLIVNQTECHPVLYVNRMCYRPIIENLQIGKLSEEATLSYISNRAVNLPDYEVSKFYRLNTDQKIREFLKQIKINF